MSARMPLTNYETERSLPGKGTTLYRNALRCRVHLRFSIQSCLENFYCRMNRRFDHNPSAPGGIHTQVTVTHDRDCQTNGRARINENGRTQLNVRTERRGYPGCAHLRTQGLYFLRHRVTHIFICEHARPLPPEILERFAGTWLLVGWLGLNP